MADVSWSRALVKRMSKVEKFRVVGRIEGAMWLIRSAQLLALGEGHRSRFIADMREHLRAHFAGNIGDWSDAALDSRIRKALDAARAYGLVSAKDGCRFLNLAATYGWDFDERNPWMRRMLEDPSISTPSERLTCLVDECVRLRDIEEAERKIFGGAQ